MHLKAVADVLTLTKTHSHHAAEVEPLKAPEPHRIVTITTVDEFEQILDDHHHRHVVVFCVTTSYKDPDVSEEGWYHHYGRLNDVHFVSLVAALALFTHLQFVNEPRTCLLYSGPVSTSTNLKLHPCFSAKTPPVKGPRSDPAWIIGLLPTKTRNFKLIRLLPYRHCVSRSEIDRGKKAAADQRLEPHW
ncbi:hypothetical protein NA56DRAFT_707508 [Hyaloscypha hepaticicola]|uniref:Uncharacterized protein n=1 Tax=Hyaloscypha hepaticicola TaxID=2082293 RepID=A0A2J6PUR5_9HELO|nr:hypothetical protein NA56DRAFT_707508 [Hyaloscypha hepaticicola]